MIRTCTRYIGLVRVSTERQGQSGLGLDAGLADLHRFIAQYGGELVEVIEEVDSGSHSHLEDRPALERAIQRCKRRRCCLLVPRVDRLVRSTEVATDIKRSGVRWRACDQPHADEVMIDVLVAIASDARRKISLTTRKGLESYKAGKRISKANRIRLTERYQTSDESLWPADEVAKVAGKLGAALLGCKLTDEGRAKGRAKMAKQRIEEALSVYKDLIPDMVAWRSAGDSLATIASRLNSAGERTCTDALWTPVQVHRTLKRVKDRA